VVSMTCARFSVSAFSAQLEVGLISEVAIFAVCEWLLRRRGEELRWIGVDARTRLPMIYINQAANMSPGVGFHCEAWYPRRNSRLATAPAFW
jgi:hypothetical protein